MNARPRHSILRNLARRREAKESCELCSVELAPVHRHLWEPTTRRLLCSCPACSLLFEGRRAGRYRVVPEGVELLVGFQMTDIQWDELRIPINLAFFCRNSATGRVTAAYPSPAGPTESLLPLDAWQELEVGNPVLGQFEPDVEALLVNRVGTTRDHFRVGIDQCYKLVGLIRRNWRGLSGGEEAWEAIGEFFQQLKGQSHSSEGAVDA
jgi:Family of unknown function (DUF5947)